jgi:hypothetical protein
MAENKTRPTHASVSAFLDEIQDLQLREDCQAILEVMKMVSSAEPVLWGDAIIGFGSYHYKYESGREGDMPVIGFSPRKQNISIYLMGGLHAVEDELSRLGRHKTGKGCLYIKSLSDVDMGVFKNLIFKAYKEAMNNPLIHANLH